MSKTILGKVSVTPKKAYNNATTYKRLDIVTYDGCSYMCLKTCTGVTPVEGEYWQLLADKGHFTAKDKEEFKKAVVEESKVEINEHTDNKKTELNNYTTELEKSLENELDTYKAEKETQMDSHKATLETEMANKKDSLIEEIETAQNGFDANVEEKTNTFNSNVKTKTTEFNNNSNAKTEEFNNNSTEKINNFNSNAEEKIADYNKHVETLTSRIADLEEETNDLFNALDTEKISGNELYIEDAKPCRVINAGISGMYKQETTTGAQLIDYKIIESCSGNTKYTFTNKILEITVTNNANSNIAYNITNAIKNNPGKTLYFNCKSYKFNEGISPKVQLLIKKDNNITYNTIFDSSGEKKPCNIPADTSDITSASIRFVTNNTNTVASTKISVTEPIISFVPNAKYEPYTGGNPSPNPDYPQEIKQVESVVLNACNKNFLNLGTQLNGYANESYKYFNGDDNAIGFYFKTEQLPDNIYISSKNGNRTAVSYYNEIPYKTLPYLERDFSNSKDRTIKVNKNYKYIHIQFSIGITQVTEMQIERETTKTDYKLSQAKAINIDLKGNKLCAVSDTIKDKLLIDRNGNVALQKNVSLITLKKDNIVSRTVLSNGDILYRTTRSIINSNNIFVLCNYYIGIPNISSRKNETIYCNTSNSDSIDIIDNNASITTADEYKTFVENKQIEVYYALATPEIIDLGQLTELPKTFEGINNIWAETNLGNTEIEIEYVQDVKKLLEKQAEQQNARLDSIEALLSTTETSALLLDNMQTDLESEVK